MNNRMSEAEFINKITENIHNEEIEDLSIRFIGYDYTLEGLDLAECLSDTYKQMPTHDLMDFEEEINNMIF